MKLTHDKVYLPITLDATGLTLQQLQIHPQDEILRGLKQRGDETLGVIGTIELTRKAAIEIMEELELPNFDVLPNFNDDEEGGVV